MEAPRHLYRPTEAAATLGLSRARVYALMATGQLASVKIGASRRIPATDLAAFVERLRSEQGVGSPASREAATAA